MKKILALLLVLCMVVALAACGAAKDEPKTDDTKKEDTKKEDTKKEDTKKDEEKSEAAPAEYTGSANFDWAAYEGTTVEIMWQDSDDTQIDITENFAKPHLQEIGDQYGITFDWVSSVGNSITTLAATGDMPDIWFSSVTLEMIQSDILLDMTPYVTVDSYLQDTFNSPDFFYFNDHIWALSTGVDAFYTGTLYYNKTMLDEVGITDISTYSALKDALQKLADAGKGGLTYEGQGPGLMGRFLWQNSLVGIDVDAYKAIISGDKDAFKNEAVVKSLQNIEDLHDAGFTPKGLDVKKTADAIAEWGMGDYAFLYTDSWNNPTVQEAVDNGGFEVGVAWWPVDNAAYKTGDYIAGWGSPLSGWSISSQVENPELCIETVKQILVAEAARHLNAGLGTNHVQTAAPVPANKVEELRLAIYDEVGTFLKGWMQNSVDGATDTEFRDILTLISSEDKVDIAEQVAQMDSAWQSNTFFG